MTQGFNGFDAVQHLNLLLDRCHVRGSGNIFFTFFDILNKACTLGIGNGTEDNRTIFDCTHKGLGGWRCDTHGNVNIFSLEFSGNGGGCGKLSIGILKIKACLGETLFNAILNSLFQGIQSRMCYNF